MATPPRLIPLLAQFDFARKRLADRLAGPEGALLRDLYRARHRI